MDQAVCESVTDTDALRRPEFLLISDFPPDFRHKLRLFAGEDYDAYEDDDQVLREWDREDDPLSRAELRKLAQFHGVQTAYDDAEERRRTASAETVMAVLRALGVPVEREEDAVDVLRRSQWTWWKQVAEPVMVCHGELVARFRLPTQREYRRYELTIELESGESRKHQGSFSDWKVVRSYSAEGVALKEYQSRLPGSLPWGYHRLTLEVAGEQHESLVISAPTHVYNLWTGSRRRSWGVFLPLYALHSERTRGMGDLTDLEELTEWTRSQGGAVTATLPLLASFWEETEDVSPYAPASRMFWNEFYLDVERLDGWEDCAEAWNLSAAATSSERAAGLPKTERVDYAGLISWKSAVLNTLAEHVRTSSPRLRERLDRYRRGHPDVDDYARFRALCTRHGLPWTDWPQRLRDGDCGEGDVDEKVYFRHLYAQWQMAGQLQRLKEKEENADSIWYLDLPLGVNRAGYDTWREREAFAMEANGGAPPDAFFSKGQNWLFPPLHPEGLRRSGYRYLIAVLREQLRYARLLRIDHAACLHRMYWIPEGMEATEGTYVRYPAEEFYAVLALESHRAGAGIVGEDLGTVPRYVTLGLQRHGIQSMYILPFEIETDRVPEVRTPGKLSLASLNTHDMPPFASFWRGSDIDLRAELGLIESDTRHAAREERAQWCQALVRFLRRHRFLEPDQEGLDEVIKACLRFLTRSPAELVLVNLEDLWLEEHLQNMPGTYQEHPNWRHRAALSLKQISASDEVKARLQLVADERPQQGRTG